jgi:hypothetical protein
LSDYDLAGPYVAEIKGIILRIAPDATVVDISHDIRNHEIIQAAFNLARSVSFFPANTVHIVLVNPNHGSDLRPIIIESQSSFFVGFDSGLLVPAARKSGIKKVYEITNSKILPERESDTFFGRDVLAPTGALLARGMLPSEIGKEVSEYVCMCDFEVEISENRVRGRVVHIDSLGNLETSIESRHLQRIGITENSVLIVNILGKEYKMPFVRKYSAVNKDEPLVCICGGYVEISRYLGNASSSLGHVKKGDDVSIAVAPIF